MGRLRDDASAAGRAADIVRALSHPDRLRIVAALCERSAGATDLAAQLGLTRDAVAQHLEPLLALRLVKSARGDGAPVYQVAEPTLHGLIACMEESSC